MTQALRLGVHVFDASAAGWVDAHAPGATGILATEDLLYLLHGMGFETGVDLDRVVDASTIAEQALGTPLPSRARQAVLAARRRARVG